MNWGRGIFKNTPSPIHLLLTVQYMDARFESQSFHRIFLDIMVIES